MNLKDRAIYKLPNGRELVSCVNGGNEIILFSLSASESGVYELNSEGRLLIGGQLTAWQIDDLLDTGRVAAPRVKLILAEGFMEDRDTTNESI